MNHVIGEGRLTWHREERISDRYGFVYLVRSGDSTTPGVDPADVTPPQVPNGTRGRLIATVLAARQSTHIGDLFHRVFPTKPDVGEVIELGDGLLCVAPRDEHGVIRFGLTPAYDDRDTLWLNIHALYRCHEQTVRLEFVEE